MPNLIFDYLFFIEKISITDSIVSLKFFSIFSICISVVDDSSLIDAFSLSVIVVSR